MKKIPKKENFFRNLIKNKIYRELWKIEENFENCGVGLRPARLDHAHYFPRCRNRNRSHNPIKRLHLFYYQRTLLPSITFALGRYSQNRSICRFFGMKKPHVSFLSHGAFYLKKSWLF